MVKYEIVADASSSGVIVEVSNDNSNWGTVTSLSESGNGVYSLGGFVLESGYSAIRYVRIKFDDGTGQTGKVYLVQVY